MTGLWMGSWRIAPSRGTISDQAGTTHLEPKVMEVLLALARRPGEVVTKAELLAAVWTGTAVVDAVITRAVSQLRIALRDDARAPRYIETIPKRGYRLVAAVLPATPDPSPGQRGSRSLAVLPFQNLSGDRRQEHLAAAMTEHITARLAQDPSLRVVSRTSVARYKDTRQFLPEIARELNVRLVVEGGVARSGGELGVVAQLVDGESDEHLWAWDYRRAEGNVLETRSELARVVANGIVARLGSERRAALGESSNERMWTEHRVQAGAAYAARTAVPVSSPC
jgi:TolB-like protein